MLSRMSFGSAYTVAQSTPVLDEKMSITYHISHDDESEHFRELKYRSDIRLDEEMGIRKYIFYTNSRKISRMHNSRYFRHQTDSSL